ncbi:hypothetical protein [Methylocystis bryophila]|uniref:Uncharacterized protein n=1 Tax=Methylocystis bryophila TaxID=655015 RepID=A0A1W6MSU6_9HYPH|nr:hypothetical protein [Methylocystis bryophila]ARN80664.1 hypothetical protein B1812_05805 [Methylocystis bryophila]BDV40733.1 hypothetical protein DSM21852_39860 [Methylocystis bryophila]
MPDQEVEFNRIVEAAIAHSKSCLADGSVETSEVIAGLLTMRKDLKSRGAPVQALGKLDAFLRSLRPCPHPNNSLNK